MQLTAESVNLDEFAPAERVALLGRVWDSLIALNGVPEVPEWHLGEVRRRLALSNSDPNRGIPLEQLRAELLGAKA